MRIFASQVELLNINRCIIIGFQDVTERNEQDTQKFILSSSQGVVPSNDKISLFAIYQDESIYGLFVFHVKYKLHSFPCWETPYFEEQFFYFSPNSV